jgi:hypothetical protein
MLNVNMPAPHNSHPVQVWALMRVLWLTEQRLQLSGRSGRSKELVLSALRKGEIRARGLCEGEATTRWIKPFEWKRLTIAIESNEILQLNTPIVRKAAHRGGPPAITQVALDAEQVKRWLPNVPNTALPIEKPIAVERGTPRLSTKKLLADEHEYRKEQGVIPDTITPYSRQLAEWILKLSKTDKRVRPSKPRSIENRLREWGMWPIK